ncbi:MAG: phage tail tube protein [Parvibaculales bacterium]
MPTPDAEIYAAKAVRVALRVDTDSSYQNLAGLNLRDLQFTQQPLKFSGARQMGRWQQFLASQPEVGLFLRGDGVFVGGGQNEPLKRALLSGTVCDGQIYVPGLGHFTGFFMLTRLRYLGAGDDLMRWQFDLTSNGDVSFAAD